MKIQREEGITDTIAEAFRAVFDVLKGLSRIERNTVLTNIIAIEIVMQKSAIPMAENLELFTENITQAIENNMANLEKQTTEKES